MVNAATIKFSAKGEPLTEDEIAAFRAQTFELKCIPEHEPPMELR
jgi:nucleoporin NUP42